MLDITKHIQYWQDSAQNDLETASLLIANKKVIHGLFFCHLCIEKALKALIVKNTTTIPPKSHNLNLLARQADVELNEAQYLHLAVLMKYQLEGRYPAFYPARPGELVATDYLNKTKDLLICLNQML